MPNMATSPGAHPYPYISILYLSSYVKRAGREKNKGHGVTAALSKSILEIPLGGRVQLTSSSRICEEVISCSSSVILDSSGTASNPSMTLSLSV